MLSGAGDASLRPRAPGRRPRPRRRPTRRRLSPGASESLTLPRLPRQSVGVAARSTLSPRCCPPYRPPAAFGSSSRVSPLGRRARRRLWGHRRRSPSFSLGVRRAACYPEAPHSLRAGRRVRPVGAEGSTDLLFASLRHGMDFRLPGTVHLSRIL